LEWTTKAEIFSHYAIERTPPWVISNYVRLPLKKFKYLRILRDTSSKIAGRIIQEKLSAFQQGLEGSKDLMTLLVRANAEEKRENKLSDAEVNSEVM
jgi:cytochrome P450